MASLITIELKGLRFHAFHGLFEEEKVTGNEFEVSLFVTYQPTVPVIDDISGTINYTRLYELVSQLMMQRAGLLETLAMQIAEKVKDEFPVIKAVDLAITKLNPPISGFTGSVGVRYRKDF